MFSSTLTHLGGRTRFFFLKKKTPDEHRSFVCPVMTFDSISSRSLREHPVFAALVSPGVGGEKRQPEIRLLTQANRVVKSFNSLQVSQCPIWLVLHTVIA